MKCFALAVFATAASALEHGGFTYSSHRPSHSSHQPSYSYKPTTHYQPKSGYHAPQHTQTKGYQSAPSGYGGVAAPNYSYGTRNYYHQPNHAHNPFEYSRPQIPYVAAKLSAPVYASCVLNSSSTESNGYELKFGQLPGHPIQVQGNFVYASTSGDDADILSFAIHKYGDLSVADVTSPPFTCDNTGPVFNPLQDPHITDPETRGTLTDFTVTTANQTTGIVTSLEEETLTQSALLQNLGGKNSIIGRSIVFTYDGSEDGCCVIGLDAPPAPTTPVYTPHYHPAQHYGYGGYGHGSHHGSHHGHHRGY